MHRRIMGPNKRRTKDRTSQQHDDKNSMLSPNTTLILS